MAEGENKDQSFLSADERYKYIGFDVFPGKPGNIFKSDEERKSLVANVMARLSHSEGEVRDGCTLLEQRVSMTEKWFLTVAAVLMLAAIFLPWFSGHYEIVTERLVPVERPGMVAEPAVAPVDSLAAAEDAAVTDSAAALVAETPADEAEAAPVEELAVVDSLAGDSLGAAAAVNAVPPGMTTVTQVSYEPHSMTGIGALLALGTYGSMVFSSGFVLMLSAILMIIFFLSCIALGAFNLYILFAVKKTGDEYVLYLKKMLRLNWIPVLIWLAMFVMSFMGGSYGFDTSQMVDQLGTSYGAGAFIGLSSAGIYVALGAFLLGALKGKEI